MLRPLVEDARRQVAAEFSTLNADALFDAIAFSVTLLERPTADCPVGTMFVNTLPGQADITMLAPSAYQGHAPDGFPAAYSRGWHHKNLIHECTAAFMWHHNPPRARWQLEEAPDWFVEGVQEYVAVERSPSGVRDSYRHRYLARLESETVQFGFETVQDKYADGYLILLFLVQQFDLDRIHRILNRSEPTFWDSVRASLRYDRGALFSTWSHWRRSRLQAPAADSFSP